MTKAELEQQLLEMELEPLEDVDIDDDTREKIEARAVRMAEIIADYVANPEG